MLAVPLRGSPDSASIGGRGTTALFAGGSATIEPDRITAAVGPEEVAGREILQPNAIGLVHDDAVVAEEAASRGGAEVLIRFPEAALGRARLGAVDHHCVAVHAAHVDVGRGDEDVGPRFVVSERAQDRVVARLFVVGRSDQDLAAGFDGVHGFLDRRTLHLFSVEGADAQHDGPFRAAVCPLRSRGQDQAGDQSEPDS